MEDKLRNLIEIIYEDWGHDPSKLKLILNIIRDSLTSKYTFKSLENINSTIRYLSGERTGNFLNVFFYLQLSGEDKIRLDNLHTAQFIREEKLTHPVTGLIVDNYEDFVFMDWETNPKYLPFKDYLLKEIDKVI